MTCLKQRRDSDVVDSMPRLIRTRDEAMTRLKVSVVDSMPRLILSL
jgi:hypothetical protein